MATTKKTSKAEQFLAEFDGDVDAAIAYLEANKKPRKKVKKPTGPVLVNVQGISKHYKLGGEKVQALKKASLEIHEGEFVALTGPSGSGKSTLLQLIGALDKPSEGSIVIDSHDVSKLSDRNLSNFRNRTIGFVFQFFYLQPFLSLQTNLEVPAMFARVSPKVRHGRSKELAKRVGLAERLKHRPKELSGGQMQRAAIARALLNGPKLILADEPTGNLDSANGQAIIDLFDEIRHTLGTTIVVVTHDPKIAARADREIVLTDGEIQS